MEREIVQAVNLTSNERMQSVQDIIHEFYGLAE